MAEDCTPEIETAALLLREAKADTDRLRFGFVNRSWSEATLPCFMAVLRRNWIRTQIGSGDYLAKARRRLGSVRGHWILASGTGTRRAAARQDGDALHGRLDFLKVRPDRLPYLAESKVPQHNLENKDSVLQQITEVIREYDEGQSEECEMPF